jgi:hypothetical protein
MEHNTVNTSINTNLADYTIDELFSLFDVKIDENTNYATLLSQIETNGAKLINTFKTTNPHLALFFEKALVYLTKNDKFKENEMDSLTSLLIQPNQEHDNDYLFKANNASGNPINRKTVSKLINIDSRFRIDKSAPSTNFSIKLQNPQSKIIEMKLCDLELPTTYYPISTALNNNYMWIRCHIGLTNTDIYNYIFIPDGNYYFDNLINYINGIDCLKSPELARTPLSIFFDLNYNNGGGVGTGTGKVTFGLFSEDDISLNQILTNIDIVELNFGGSPLENVTKTISMSYDEMVLLGNKYFINPNRELDPYPTFGTLLGYTKYLYTSKLSYISEGIMDIIGPRYLFLVIDDGISTSVNSNFFSADGSGLPGNTIARISLKGAAFNIQSQNDFSVYTEPRLYFGPVNIGILNIKLIDEYQRVLNLNGSNISFTLRLTCVYTS